MDCDLGIALALGPRYDSRQLGILARMLVVFNRFGDTVPIYEYRCDACDGRFEVFQRSLEQEVPSCPECGCQNTKRLISQTSFRLKGSGWYETDHKHLGSKAEKSESAEKSTETKSNDTKKSDSKKEGS